MNKAEIDIKYILESGLKALKITHTGQKSNYLSAFFLLLLEWSIKGEGEEEPTHKCPVRC